MSKFKIWIDADASPKPVKEVVYKVSSRCSLEVILVANNYLNHPHSPLIKSIKVNMGADVADQYIVDNLSEKDIVITADIPLAAFAVEKKAIAINPRGEEYNEENVREKLSMRNFMQELRDSGIKTDGPAPYGAKDKEKFTNALNRIVTRLLK